MAVRFVPVDRDTPFFLPPAVQEWLPDDHLARFVVDIVSRLDMTVIERSYSGRGSAAYHPSMLVSLLVYGYATGVFSSRRLEAATYDSIAFRFICANTHPDHDTIATFRRRFLSEVDDLFAQILVVASEMGLLKLGAVSLDGTKVKANASKHSALSYQFATELEVRIKAEVAALLQRAEEADQRDAEEALDIPEELRRRQTRLAAITEAKRRIEARAAEQHKKDVAAHEERLASRQEKERAQGSKFGGKPPQAPKPGPQDKDQLNLTDEESRIMPESGGGFEQSYNAQASVEVDSLLIVGQHISQSVNDKRELEAALDALDQLPASMGQVTTLVADNGYFSQANVEASVARGVEPLIAMGRERVDVLRPVADPPSGTSALDQMKARLLSDEGHTLYARRKCTVEPVFGIIKHVMGFRQFSLRGLKKVQGEWTLVSMAWNLKRMAKLQATLA